MKPAGALVLAAGAVLWRCTDGSAEPDRVEICLVHRPKYDDWSLPKGKVDPGEHLLTCAVREVQEEAGHRVTLGRPLPRQEYEAEGLPKHVRYWLAEADPETRFREPDQEVDEVAFLPAVDAVEKLTHPRDADLVVTALAGPLRTASLVFLRHAKAVSRSDWAGPDKQRPLNRKGQRAAELLIAPLDALGVTRVISSDAARCTETVRPFAEHLDRELELEPLISEEGAEREPAVALDSFVRDLLHDGPALVCSHRPVLPRLIAAAGVGPGRPLRPGGFTVLHHHEAQIVATERF